MYTLGISSVTLTEWSLLFGFLFFLFEKKGRMIIGHDLSIFLKAMIFMFFLSTISHIFQRDMQNIFIVRNLRLVMYILFIIIAYNMIDKELLLKFLRIVSIIACMYVLVQYLAYHVGGIYLTNQILPLPVNREVSEDIMELYDKYYFRASGFFAEPSYFAKFLIPCFAYCLNGWDNKELDYFCGLLIIVTVFFSTSLQGIIIIAFMISIELIRILHRKKISSIKIMQALIVLLFLGLVFVLFTKNEVLEHIFLRLVNLISLNIGINSSVSYRLFRGYYVFEQLPWYFQIFGIGFGGLAEYVLSNNIFTPFDASVYVSTTAAGYVNGISSILINVGIIGFSVFVFCFYRIYKLSSLTNKLILLAYLLCLFSGGGIFNLYMVYIFSIVFIGNRCYY
jgi:hypothetical protein